MEILNRYRFGSHVYGTQTKDSDEDFICVTDEKIISEDLNTKYYTVAEFQRLLDNHEIQMLECYFLPGRFILQQSYTGFSFTLDLAKLRVSISTISSNSWVKGKKKLIVQADYDKKLGVKSVFHAVRILGLGIQLAQTGKIADYSEYNWLYADLIKLSAAYDYIQLWEKMEDKYRKLYNKLNTQFKLLCPKSNIPEHRLKQALIRLFEENHCYGAAVIENKLVDKIVHLVQTSY